MRRSLVSAAVLVVVATAPAVAHAGAEFEFVDPPASVLKDDPKATVGFRVNAVGTTVIDPGTRYYVKIREGDAPCAPRWEQDPGRDVLFAQGLTGPPGRSVVASGPSATGVASEATSSYVPFHAVGRGTLCGWAQTGADASGPVLGADQHVLDVTLPQHPRLEIDGPSRTRARSVLRLRLAATAVLERRLYAALHRGSSCPAAYRRSDRDLRVVRGATLRKARAAVVRRAVRAPRAGGYRLCAWIQADGDDATAERTASAPLRVRRAR